jgi:hypothetical protein
MQLGLLLLPLLPLLSLLLHVLRRVFANSTT